MTQSDPPLQTLRTIHPHALLGILVSVLIGGNVRASTVIYPPTIDSGTVIDHPISSLIVVYVREVFATTGEYMNP